MLDFFNPNCKTLFEPKIVGKNHSKNTFLMRTKITLLLTTCFTEELVSMYALVPSVFS